MAYLQIEKFNKTFSDGFKVLKDISFSLDKGLVEKGVAHYFVRNTLRICRAYIHCELRCAAVFRINTPLRKQPFGFNR